MKNPSLRLPVLICTLAIAAGALVQTDTHAAGATSTLSTQLRAIDRYRTETWRWQKLMSKPRTPTLYSERSSRDAAYLHWVRRLWARRAAQAERQAQHPPHRRQWLCIHRYERHPRQGWATRTGNGYYGGLQMDLAFQRLYGRELLRRKGTADRWTAAEQMWVAERAHRSGRGFHPWPNTGRYCGLI
ncbi:MAG: transglycosylase family protein [Gaiellaceae bacterium]